MNDLVALLAAICSRPDEDTPRLAYADELEERAGSVPCTVCPPDEGEDPHPADIRCDACSGSRRMSDGHREYAEFVRVQCELAGLEARAEAVRPQAMIGSDGMRLLALRRRELELWRANAGRWLVSLPGISPQVITPGSETSGVILGTGHPSDTGRIERVFRRGFIDSITLTAADFLAHADAMVWHPTQTADCERCGGTGLTYWPGRGHRHGGRSTPCVAGCVKGRVPRPCPGTAQPVREVTLTTWPQVNVRRVHASGTFESQLRGLDRWHEVPTNCRGGEFYSEVCRRGILGAEFPGITFHLPEPAPV